MPNQQERIRLHGRLLLTGRIRTRTGLHIGGAETGIEIGGVDNVVIRNPLTGQPYIPGSSLRGKIRSLLEKYHGLKQNKEIRQETPKVRIHECQEANDYQDCNLCHIFGVAGEHGFAEPARLLVRDVPLDRASAEALENLPGTDLPFTEVKWEAAIDRITSAAVPRQMERVPAGAVFAPFELIYSLYDEADAGRLAELLVALELVEDDYLGGMGSRGYGQVALERITLHLKGHDHYDRRSEDVSPLIADASVAQLRLHQDEIIRSVKAKLWPDVGEEREDAVSNASRPDEET